MTIVEKLTFLAFALILVAWLYYVTIRVATLLNLGEQTVDNSDRLLQRGGLLLDRAEETADSLDALLTDTWTAQAPQPDVEPPAPTLEERLAVLDAHARPRPDPATQPIAVTHLDTAPAAAVITEQWQTRGPEWVDQQKARFRFRTDTEVAK